MVDPEKEGRSAEEIFNSTDATIWAQPDRSSADDKTLTRRKLERRANQIPTRIKIRKQKL